MALKTDYKDAAWSGNRIFEISDAGNGKNTIKDATIYTVSGDAFGAKDINTTNAAINRINGQTKITLSASGWTNTAPYTQRVNVTGITAEDLPDPKLDVSAANGENDEKKMKKQFGWITYYDTADGNITFTAKYHKPTVTLTIALKGV